VACGILLLAACGPQTPRSTPPNSETPIEPKTEKNAIGYPRGPESLAEMNPYGLHHLRDGTNVRLHDRDVELYATPFGRKAIALLEANAQVLPGFPRWRRLTAAEVYRLANRYELSEKKGDQVLRAKLLHKAATMHDSEAQACLANCYHEGLGVKRDKRAAVYWASKSMANGSGRGAFILANFYASGTGVERDLGRARQLLILGANRGHVLSQAELGWELLLGREFEGGLGFDVDLARGKMWLERAASFPLTDETSRGKRIGKTRGLNRLGVLHEHGMGVSKNETEALAHYYLAATVAETSEDKKVIRQNIRMREADMTSSARQYSQLRAQELRSSYFPEMAAGISEQAKVSFGSGVFVGRNGHLLTAAHVVEGAEKIRAKVGETSLVAEIIEVDKPNDVALLKVDASVEAAPLRPSTGVELGDEVFTIGFPNMALQGTEPKFTEGNVSSTAGMQDDPRHFQVSVQVQPGNSGGALFDKNGNVVGIIVARLDEEAVTQLTGSAPQNVNYAVKSSYALPLLEGLDDELPDEQRGSWFGTNRDVVVKGAKAASVPLAVELRPAR
jgi:S1-C subfamily serine protease